MDKKMNHKKSTKRMFMTSVLSLVLCIMMFIGTTFAWFTDNVASSGNIIKSGSLDLEMYWTDDLTTGQWKNVEEKNAEPVFSYDNWEPGYTEVRYIKIVNAGSLALNYEIALSPVGTVGKLADVINVYYINDVTENISSRNELKNYSAAGLLSDVMNGESVAEGSLLPSGQYSTMHDSESTVVAIAMTMLATAGNEYQDETIGDGFNITALATQCPYEEDSFGSDYDAMAGSPIIITPTVGSASVESVDNKVPAGGVTITASNGVSAYVPEGVLLEDNVDTLTLSVTPMEKTQSNITAINNETLTSLDVHIEGISENNTVPIIINLGAVLPANLNIGAYTLSHVENGSTNAMTLVSSSEELLEHNQFTYDPVTGAVSVCMATFSEIAALSDNENEWNGERDYDWYDADESELVIYNADQLAGFGDIVAGIAEISGEKVQDNFEGKTVKLAADINLNCTSNANRGNSNNLNFYPIGYAGTSNGENVSEITGEYGGSFRGIFDGNGNTVSNLTQNGWAMFGSYTDGEDGYYNEAMGLFGYVYGGTVKNLTIDNFEMVMEFAPMGCVAAYAGNTATFENITILNSHPQTYNTAVAGIVGCDAGSSVSTTINFKNITVDQSNTISALWETWDCAAGGLLGMLRGNNQVNFENCHVAAVMDVYNDVCANYQYYWYRYCGMMIGTINRHTKDANGYTIPDLAGITAKQCTVAFGDWNQYWYCEFEKNSQASYTEDYQFSRVSKEDISTDESGKYICNHQHTENEDKQAVYLPFNQLFTGYGWGVKAIYNVDDYENIDIQIIEAGDVIAQEKFKASSEDTMSLDANAVVSIGELFEEVIGANVSDATVQVFVSPVDENSTVLATYSAESSAWENGTLSFSGSGTAKVIITDYFYCKNTVCYVSIATTEKFDIVFKKTEQYLYRVGNGNTVALSSLFELIDDVEITNHESVKATVASLDENADASATFTANSSNWENATLKFSGTGPVSVTISGDNATAKTLCLEVVDAVNVTAYSGLGNKNSVLLNDITMSSGSSYYLSGATLYGNGFTFDMTAGTYAAGGNISSNYVFGLNNAHIDNVKIVGAVYTTYGATVQSEYNRAAVLSTGSNTITNSYVSNCASAVRVKDGNLEIVNSTIKGGNFANIDIRGGHVVLDNVTTINQVNGNDTAADGTVVVGLGVVVYYENVLSTTTVEVKNGITQYNHLSEKQANTYITDSTAKQLTAKMFESDYSAIQYADDSDTWVNTGILSMTESVGDDNITDIDGYVEASPEMTSVTGYIHTKKPDAMSVATSAPSYETAGQGAIAPSYSFDYTMKNYVAKVDGSNDYCYAEGGTVYISMDAGDTFSWDTSILTATKLGNILDYTVAMNGTDYTGKSITFETGGDYEVIYTYTDSNNYEVDDNGEITTYSKTYTKTVHISVAVIEANAKSAEFTFGSSNTVTEKITVDNVTYVSATGVEYDGSSWAYMTVGSEKIYYPIVAAKLTSTKGSSSIAYFPVFEEVVTITDYADGGTGDAVTYNSSTTTLPSGLTAVKGIYKAAADVTYWYNLTNSNLTQSGASNIFKWASSSSAESTPTTYNSVLCYKSPTISANRDKYITLVQYSYTDATNTTYYYYVGYTIAAYTYQACVTPDTLVTLADGTQKEIQNVTYEDELLVWDFVNGEYTTATSSIVMNHGYDNYKVVTLNFEDGTVVHAINGHGFYDVDTNEFVILSENNVEDYMGHDFIKRDGESNTVTQLVSYSIKEEYTESWSILTAEHYNCVLEGMLTITPAEVEGSPKYLMPFEVGEGMKYDKVAMQADIEKYGLYTYEEFADLLTYEQFQALNLPYFKVAVGKGFITYEEILYLIDLHM